MIGLLLDALVLYGIIAILQGEMPEFGDVFFVLIGIAVLNFVVVLALSSGMGDAGLWVALPIIVVADGFILMYFLGLTIKQAGLAMLLMLVYRAGLNAALSAMMT